MQGSGRTGRTAGYHRALARGDTQAEGRAEAAPIFFICTPVTFLRGFISRAVLKYIMSQFLPDRRAVKKTAREQRLAAVIFMQRCARQAKDSYRYKQESYIMNLLFTRHGETDWNVQKRIQGSTDTDLNENGRMQAVRLARQLETNRIRPERIFTSPLKRACQTARIVSEKLNTECIVRDGLEEINFGLWEGLTWTQVEDQYPEEFTAWYENRRYQKTPMGESYQDLLDRLLPSLRSLVEEETEAAGPGSPSHSIVLVTHSAVIMSLMAYLNNTPFNQMVSHYKLNNTGIVQIKGERLLT